MICLASSSPRRRALLAQIGVTFRVVEAGVDETPHAEETPALYVVRLALAKARAGLAAGSRVPVLAADTAVAVEETTLGKPRDRADALAMLQQLSGNTHHVYTGVALVTQDGEEWTRLSVSAVTFRPLEPGEAEAYWASGEPADKAGGYAIQGRGAMFIERLEGSYSGVMGLPLYETVELLRQTGVEPLRREPQEQA